MATISISLLLLFAKVIIRDNKKEHREFAYLGRFSRLLTLLLLTLSSVAVFSPITHASTNPLLGLDGVSHFMPAPPSCGAGIGNGNYDTCVSLGLNTTKANDAIIIVAEPYWGQFVKSISDKAGLNFTLRTSLTTWGSPCCLYEYHAIASSILTNDNITLWFHATRAFQNNLDAFAFAVSGVAGRTSYDPSSSLPAQTNACTQTYCSLNITTSRPHDFAFAMVFSDNPGCTTNDWTSLHDHAHLQVYFGNPAGKGQVNFTCQGGVDPNQYPDPLAIIGDALSGPGTGL